MNQQITLANRPIGEPQLSDFKLVETAVPEIKDGQVLLRTKYFSLDPYMRPRMTELESSYVESYHLGEVLDGAAVCVVEQTKNPNFQVGDLVLTSTGWQKYSVYSGDLASHAMLFSPNAVIKLPTDVTASHFLGALGMAGLTAYYGLLKIGQPKSGETLVVSAATGAVGSMVGQLAKARGCRVVGIAGGPKKCRYAVDQLGFDACIDHNSKTMAQDLKQACPNGIDINYENVGGHIFATILPLLNEFARVVVCGAVATYNDSSTLQTPGWSFRLIFSKLKAFYRLFLHRDLSPLILLYSIGKRLKIQGFIVSDHADVYEDFLKETIPLIQSGKIKVNEDIVKGIENAPQAFIGLLRGKNLGKLIVEIE